ncbi:MAG: hypothetical protein CMI26_07445 [Opitutae bacterium]|nr:hypothetical protein [Opitutae bacterium]|tara:strand:+ start:2685 stop:3107 length:423 start_codon:yes stop_codon:yes gene_type:complete
MVRTRSRSYDTPQSPSAKRIGIIRCTTEPEITTYGDCALVKKPNGEIFIVPTREVELDDVTTSCALMMRYGQVSVAARDKAQCDKFMKNCFDGIEDFNFALYMKLSNFENVEEILKIVQNQKSKVFDNARAMAPKYSKEQ